MRRTNENGRKFQEKKRPLKRVRSALKKQKKEGLLRKKKAGIWLSERKENGVDFGWMRPFLEAESLGTSRGITSTGNCVASSPLRKKV